MPSRSPPSSPKQTITIRGRRLKVGDRLPLAATITRIGGDAAPLVTVQFPDGNKLSFRADSLPLHEGEAE